MGLPYILKKNRREFISNKVLYTVYHECVHSIKIEY